VISIRIGIVGSRRRKDENNVRQLVRELYKKYGKNIEIISGGCKGVDTWAIDEARKLGMDTTVYLPDLFNIENYFDVCNRYYERNKLIVKRAKDGIYAFVSKDRTGGTENTVKYAKRLNIEVIIK